MRGRQILRIAAVLAAALAFGVLAAVIKGNGSGWRDGVGNLSAPWLIVPMVAAAMTARRTWLGAVIGMLATVAALVGFYLANAFVLDLGAHSTLRDLGLTLGSGTFYLRAGLVSGPVMGMLGVWAARRGRRFLVAIAAGLLCFEPLLTYVFTTVTHGWWAAGNGAFDGVYAAESVFGLLVAAVLWRTRPQVAHR
jgi:hypothetical protein